MDKDSIKEIGTIQEKAKRTRCLRERMQAEDVDGWSKAQKATQRPFPKKVARSKKARHTKGLEAGCSRKKCSIARTTRHNEEGLWGTQARRAAKLKRTPSKRLQARPKKKEGSFEEFAWRMT